MADRRREVEVPEFWVFDRETYASIVVERKRMGLSYKQWFEGTDLEKAADFQPVVLPCSLCSCLRSVLLRSIFCNLCHCLQYY